MTNLAKTLNSYIKSNIQGLKIYNDLFPDDSTEGVISIHDPTTRKTAEFIDGSAEYQLNITYTARYKDSKASRETLEKILELLDGKKLTDNTDNLKIQVFSVSNVQFNAIDNKNTSYYSCSVKCIYTKN